MIVGRFDDRGRPYVAARVVVERLGVNAGIMPGLQAGLWPWNPDEEGD